VVRKTKADNANAMTYAHGSHGRTGWTPATVIMKVRVTRETSSPTHNRVLAACAAKRTKNAPKRAPTLATGAGGPAGRMSEHAWDREYARWAKNRAKPVRWTVAIVEARNKNAPALAIANAAGARGANGAMWAYAAPRGYALRTKRRPRTRRPAVVSAAPKYSKAHVPAPAAANGEALALGPIPADAQRQAHAARARWRPWARTSAVAIAAPKHNKTHAPAPAAANGVAGRDIPM
jgi:hypothetical protein